MLANSMRGNKAIWPWVALRMTPGVGQMLFGRLLRRFGDPGDVLAASVPELERAGAPPPVARAITSGTASAAAKEDVARAATVGARILTCLDPDYPSLLRGLEDAPPYLYVRGRMEPQDALGVAVVGSRAASRYGRDVAAALARGFAGAGVTVVSGLAHGIDGVAHEAAVASGGRTIAVLGSGVDVIYPRAHVQLAARIIAHGAVVSEFFMGTPPRSGHFPIRNRVISGLSRGTVVVEATERSGSLITARKALEQGRDVFAVPGPITAARSRGTHLLLQHGAKLVTEAADVLEELGVRMPGRVSGLPMGAVSENVTVEMCEDSAQVLHAIGDASADVDSLVVRTGLTPPNVLRILLELELSGFVRQLPGGVYEFYDTRPDPTREAESLR